MQQLRLRRTSLQEAQVQVAGCQASKPKPGRIVLGWTVTVLLPSRTNGPRRLFAQRSSNFGYKLSGKPNAGNY